jgi:hypothetical protein
VDWSQTGRVNAHLTTAPHIPSVRIQPRRRITPSANPLFLLIRRAVLANLINQHRSTIASITLARRSVQRFKYSSTRKSTKGCEICLCVFHSVILWRGKGETMRLEIE